MLDEIVARVRQDLPAQIDTFDAVKTSVSAGLGEVPPFGAVLQTPGLAVIAEVKRRSPSRGDIDPGLDPVSQANRYAEGGAAAISVLTEPHYFAGSPADLQAVATAVKSPVLRKDFIVHPVQVWQARLWGAAAVLLIAAVLEDGELRRLRVEAEELGMDALVEAHDEEELTRALRSGATVVGVNNRDLTTFEVDLATAERLARLAGEAPVAIAESGIWRAEDAARMAAAGYDGVLVGEALVRAGDPQALIRSFS